MSFGRNSGSRSILSVRIERLLIVLMFVLVLGLGYALGELLYCVFHNGCPR